MPESEMHASEIPASEMPETGAPEAESAQLRAIMDHPSYRRADLDLDWIAAPEMRGTRLLLEYAKPQLILTRNRVVSTIVLFGGARIKERKVAEQALHDARAAVKDDSGDPEKQRAVQAAKRAVENSRYYDVARDFARMVSAEHQSDEKRHFVIITGGGPGIMEAGNRGAHDADAVSIGLNIELPFEQEPNRYITPELCFQFRYFAIRKMHFLAAAKALVAFPGGFGTFDELFETLCLIQTQTIEPVPVVLVGTEFWKRAFDPEFLRDEGVISARDVDLIQYAETAEEIMDAIMSWYEERGVEKLSGQSPYRSSE